MCIQFVGLICGKTVRQRRVLVHSLSRTESLGTCNKCGNNRAVNETNLQSFTRRRVHRDNLGKIPNNCRLQYVQSPKRPSGRALTRIPSGGIRKSPLIRAQSYINMSAINWIKLNLRTISLLSCTYWHIFDDWIFWFNILQRSVHFTRISNG